MAKRQKVIADTDAVNIGDGVMDPVDVMIHRYGGDEYDDSPVMVSSDAVEGAKALQGQDLERATGDPLAGAEAAAAAGVDPTEVAVPEAGPVSGGATSTAETIEKTMPNGAQLDKVIAALQLAADKKLPPESVFAFLSEFYPISPETAKAVLGPIGTTWFAGGDEPAAAPPAFAAQQAKPFGAPADDEEEEEQDDA